MRSIPEHLQPPDARVIPGTVGAAGVGRNPPKLDSPSHASVIPASLITVCETAHVAAAIASEMGLSPGQDRLRLSQGSPPRHIS